MGIVCYLSAFIWHWTASAPEKLASVHHKPSKAKISGECFAKATERRDFHSIADPGWKTQCNQLLIQSPVDVET